MKTASQKFKSPAERDCVNVLPVKKSDFDSIELETTRQKLAVHNPPFKAYAFLFFEPSSGFHENYLNYRISINMKHLGVLEKSLVCETLKIQLATSSPGDTPANTQRLRFGQFTVFLFANTFFIGNQISQ